MALTVEGLTVRLGHKMILQDVAISFAVGKRTAIIGPNGAGKSTLLKVLAGLNGDYSGKVLLDGKDLRSIQRQQLAQQLAILPQGMTAPLDTTVRQLVDYGRFPYRSWLHGSNANEDRKAVEWALSVTQMEELQEQQVAVLSGGERQRAWLAMALAQQPKILLLDEPTTYLDIAHQLEVMQIIGDLEKHYGMTIIMVVHDINHALQYADAVAIVKNQGIFAQGQPEAVLTPEIMAQVFGVEAELLTGSDGHLVLAPIGIAAANDRSF